MNRAKIALIGIALFGVVGGALAFKARNTRSLYFTTAGTTRCTFEVIGVYTTFAPNQLPVSTLPTALATTPGVCTTTTLYYTAP